MKSTGHVKDDDLQNAIFHPNISTKKPLLKVMRLSVHQMMRRIYRRYQKSGSQGEFPGASISFF
jgi:hypothetical protein